MRRMIFGLSLTILGLYIAFHKFDPSTLRGVLIRANGKWILLGVALLVFSVWIRTVRWQILMRPLKSVGLRPLFSTTMIGYFGNAILPLRLGELLRAYSIHTEERSITPAAAFGTIVVERLLDVMGLVAVTGIVFSQYDVPFWLLNAGIFLGIVLVGSLLLYWWVWRSHRSWIERFENTPLLKGKMGSKARYLAQSFFEGLNVLRKTRRIGFLVFYTAVLWVIYGVIAQASAMALGITLTWVEVGVILVATSMVISVPSAPGYVGTYHAAAVLIMVQMLGKSESISQAYAILSHAVGFVPLVAIGFVFLLRSSVRLGEIRGLKMGEEETE
ncbi:MAG: lysylphosphatidylglycerol synthase transmembrane domain-containing protein [Candidatus Neomarinimicrobiota bacterium]